MLEVILLILFICHNTCNPWPVMLEVTMWMLRKPIFKDAPGGPKFHRGTKIFGGEMVRPDRNYRKIWSPGPIFGGTDFPVTGHTGCGCN